MKDEALSRVNSVTGLWTDLAGQKSSVFPDRCNGTPATATAFVQKTAKQLEDMIRICLIKTASFDLKGLDRLL